VQAVAVSFLYGFVRPEHEQRAVAILREELPDVFISAGHEIAPEFREFERLSTVVPERLSRPVMGHYLRRLSPRLEALGMTATQHLTQVQWRLSSASRTAGRHAGAHHPLRPSRPAWSAPQAIGAARGAFRGTS